MICRFCRIPDDSLARPFENHCFQGTFSGACLHTVRRPTSTIPNHFSPFLAVEPKRRRADTTLGSSLAFVIQMRQVHVKRITPMFIGAALLAVWHVA